MPHTSKYVFTQIHLIFIYILIKPYKELTWRSGERNHTLDIQQHLDTSQFLLLLLNEVSKMISSRLAVHHNATPAGHSSKYGR